jgi:glycosyltransferase involved in cell wall biosynthesis
LAERLHDQRLKVLFITAWYPTESNPVAGNFVREHARAVLLFDDVVVLHCAGKDAVQRKTLRLEEETDPELARGIPTYHMWHRRALVPGGSSLTYIRDVMAAFRGIVSNGFRPDLIHAHIYEAGVPAVWLSRRECIPTVITEHSSDFPRRRLPPWQIWKARFAFRRADRVLPVSRMLQQAIQGYGIQGRFEIVPNAVDTNLFHPPSVNPPSEEPKHLLFVGSLRPEKGLPNLLVAAAQLRQHRDDWRMDIVGDGAEALSYRQLCAELGLSDRVTFHGAQPSAEVAGFMQRASILVLPSEVETFSVAAVEALACGVPVLATYCGGPEEYLTAETGLMVPTGDVEALCQGLATMLAQLPTYSPTEIASYARRRFSHEAVGARIHGIYQACLDRTCQQKRQEA